MIGISLGDVTGIGPEVHTEKRSLPKPPSDDNSLCFDR